MLLKVDAWALVFAKFVPELLTISAAMADVTSIAFPRFLSLIGIGAVLFASIVVEVGRVFHDEVTYIVLVLANVGKLGVILIFAFFGLYLVARWWRRRVFIRQFLREPHDGRPAS
jgi:membrane protein DedA with SNARE-associated domain